MRRNGYQRTLVEKRTEVLSHLGYKFDAEPVMGRVAEDDQAQIWHDQFVCARIDSLDLQKLRMIEEALDRLASGEYGVCLRCGEQIPDKRLRAIPWARYCIACQEKKNTKDVPTREPACPRQLVA